MTDKQELRRKIRAIGVSADERKRFSEVLCRKALAYAATSGAQGILSFASLPDEPDTTELNRLLAERGYRLFLPKMTGENTMIACLAPDPDDLTESRYGFGEPRETAEGSFELAFVPMVAFDGRKYRLGRGKGCYDRFLAEHPVRTVGLSYSCRMTETVYPEPHDIPLNIILTEAFELE